MGGMPPASARRAAGDVAAVLSYLLLAVWITRGLWAAPAGQVLLNGDDHEFFLAMMAHGERVVYHGETPFYFTRLNVPTGVNMMANTSVLAISIPLAPFTHALGPAVAVALMATGALAGTATAWWWVLRRHLVGSGPAAWIGGLWTGFAPGFLAHANGQPNLACGFVVPFIVWQVIRLREPARILRGGSALGVLIALQAFVGEEFLLLLAITMALIAVAYAAMRWREALEAGPRFLAGLAVAALVAGLLLAYPLYQQFRGPGHYTGLPFPVGTSATTLRSIAAFPRSAIAGSAARAREVNGGSVTEESVFWGPGACLMILVSIAVLWRSAAARATALAGLVMLVLSFGTRFRLDRTTTTGAASPLGFVTRLPLLDLVTTPRDALASTTIAGVLMALAADRVHGFRWFARVPYWTGIALAFVPLFPKPLPTSPAPPMPAFFADGTWRSYVHGDQTVVIVPLPSMRTGRTAMRIAALNTFAFPVPRGYFMGPQNAPADDRGSWSPPPRFTVTVLDQLRRTGTLPPISVDLRRAMLADLRYWHAGVVVLLPDMPHQAAVRGVLADVLGTPEDYGGVAVWRVPPPPT